MNLTSALAWRDISSKIRLRFPCIRNIIDAGLLTEKEYEKLQDINEPSPGIRWLTPLHWVQQLIDAEIAAGRGNTTYVSIAMNELKAFRVSFRRLYCNDWVCVPLVYTQVAALATYSYFFFCLFGRQDLNSDDFYSLDAFFPLFTVVQFLFFVGWFKNCPRIRTVMYQNCPNQNCPSRTVVSELSRSECSIRTDPNQNNPV
uniref:Bestrophin homolog n=1 Tax=Caenorhabditis japonica TaxID=281687 RepID=A0A8R1DZB0_CAEJA